MHALGFRHEHQRPDRDKYIKVHIDNVFPDFTDEFEIVYHDWSPFNKGWYFHRS